MWSDISSLTKPWLRSILCPFSCLILQTVLNGEENDCFVYLHTVNNSAEGEIDPSFSS